MYPLVDQEEEDIYNFREQIMKMWNFWNCDNNKCLLYRAT
jgi:hypothetical protein